MKIKKAPVVWKKEGGMVVIMSKKGIFQLNLPASQLWLSLDGTDFKDLGSSDYIDYLRKYDLIEDIND